MRPSALLLLPLLACRAEAPAPLSEGAAPPPGRSFKLSPATTRVEAAVPPIALLASDGTALHLREVEAHAVVEDPLAWTELHLRFENPDPRVLEGRFQIALPEGASITRFAMNARGYWQEGEIVERRRAQQVYEDFLHQRQDPALLENEAGNLFSARVFPIQPRATVEILVSYVTELPSGVAAFRIPLQGLGSLDRVDITALLSAPATIGTATDERTALQRQETLSLHEQRWTPDRDFTLPAPAGPRRRGLRGGDFIVAHVGPPVTAPVEPVPSLFVLVDTSASRALNFEDDLYRLGALAAALAAGEGADTPFAVVAFDQDVTPVFEGEAGDFGDDDLQRLRELLPLGASDPGRALGWLSEHLRDGKSRYDRVLMLTDGVATAGERDPARLKAAVAALREREVNRLDVLTSGGIVDEEGLDGLVTAGLPHDGVVLNASLGLPKIVAKLERATRSGIQVEAEGVSWVWPESFDGVQPGDERMIYAAALPGQTPHIRVGGVELTGSFSSGQAPLVDRAVAAARVDRLVGLRDGRFAQDPDMRAALAKQATEVALQGRVLSPWTALLVLDSWWDYQRYGIDQQNLAAVVSVTPSGLSVVDGRDRNSGWTGWQAPTTASRATAAPSRSRSADNEGGLSDAGATGKVDRRANVEEDRWAGFDKDEAPSTPVQGAAGAEEKESPNKAAERSEAMGSAVMGSEVMDSEVTEAAPPAPPSSGPAAAAPLEIQAEAMPLAEAAKSAVPSDDGSSGVAGLHGVSGLLGTGSGGGGRGAPSGGMAVAADPVAQPTGEAARPLSTAGAKARVRPPPPPPKAAPWTGRYAEVQAHLSGGDLRGALGLAQDWRASAPGDVLALLALGEAYARSGEARQAARAYGSLIDLYPSRADLRRAAANRLEGLLDPAALPLAVDSYRVALDQRPDHPTAHHLLAMALAKNGDLSAAFEVIIAGQRQGHRWNQEPGIRPVLQEDAATLGAALVAQQPARREEVTRRLGELGLQMEVTPSLRFVLTWETDANDVDLHVTDRTGEEAYFAHRALASGGALHMGVFNGYGPECFTLRGASSGWPYRFQAHYYRRGPMGWGIGKLQIISHDGAGNLRFDERPYVVMNDDAWVDLGTLASQP